MAPSLSKPMNPRLTTHGGPVVEAERREHPRAGRSVEGAVLHDHRVVVLVDARRGHAAVERRLHARRIDGLARRHHVAHVDRRLLLPGLDEGLVVALLVEAAQLPEPEQHHRHDQERHGHVADDPLRS